MSEQHADKARDLVQRLRGWWDDPTEGMSGREAHTDDLIQEAASFIETHLVSASPTDDLVHVFALAMKAKLRASQVKYGWNDAWKNPDNVDALRDSLFHHLHKGDPVDVANLAAMIWSHGASSVPANDPLALLRSENARLRHAIQHVLDEIEDGSVTCMTCGDEEPLNECDFVEILKDALKEQTPP